jgi:hypothetical protein
MRMFGLKGREEEQEKEAANTNSINMRFTIFTLHQILLGLSNEE